MRRGAAVVASSVVAAAFLGPGTIATATRAGVDHGAGLLWTLAVATLVCFVLQEAAAESTVARGRDLGEVLRERFGAGSIAARGIAGAVILGCAAYEAGNILGGVSGLRLVVDVPASALTAVCVIAAAGLLARGGAKALRAVLSCLVAWMGLAFVATAWALRPDLGELVRGLVPSGIPEGGLLVTLGLVGTTVVPYNLFLGSGVARGQSRSEMRGSLALVVGLGGLVSMAVLVVGTAAPDPGFAAVGDVLAERLGAWARGFFALGLFAAGFTSAVTAPLAAQITWNGLGSVSPKAGEGEGTTTGPRGVAFAVLAFGAVFGLAEVPPLPVIVLAQALNGLLLPVVAVSLLSLDRERRFSLRRAALLAACAFTLLLGARGVAASVGRVLPVAAAWTVAAVAVAAAIAFGLRKR